MLRMFGHHISTRALSFAVLELLAFLVGFNIARTVTFGGSASASLESQGQVYLLLLSSLVIVITSAACGLYNKSMSVQSHSALSRLLIVSLLMYALMAWMVSGASTMLPGFEGVRFYYVITLVGVLSYFLTAFFIRHKSFEMHAGKTFLQGRVLVLGVDECAAKIEYLNGSSVSPYTTVGFMRIGHEECSNRLSESKILPATMLQSPAGLLEQARKLRANEIVIASRERRGLPTDALIECKLAGIAITDFASFWERQTGQVDLDELKPGWIIFSDGFRTSWLKAFSKRACDIVVALALLIITLPITVAAAVAIRCDSAGPLFYRQERVGRNGVNFTIYKFRSMRMDAEKDGVARWAQANDHRVTRSGKFLRRTRIDEIPQVINVLLGQMSFVGPRPERPVFVEALARKIPLYNVRHRMKPGITGWAQINYPYGASDEDAKAKFAYDLYYAKNWSLFLDVVILAQTARVVLWPEGVR